MNNCQRTKARCVILLPFICLLLWGATFDSSVDPMEGREEKLKGFRERRDKFFKEDAASPLKESDRKRFKGLSYYPVDLKFALIVSVEPYSLDPDPIYVDLSTNKGRRKKYVRHGRFRFRLEGKEYVLQIYRPPGESELFLPFKDATSGTETYMDGRYLHIEPALGEKVLVDFNRAYNPFCAYNERYTCPFAPQENWLSVPVRAGEKRFR